MVSMLRRRIATALVAAGIGVGMGAAAAQPYPDKPIRLVVPYPPGGVADFLGRLLAQKLTESRGWQVVVENKAGAATLIGTAFVANADADGYTLLVTSNSFTVNPSLRRKIPYDTEHDFTPVILAAAAPHVLAVNARLPVDSVKDLIALAKSRPGELTAGSSGVGTAVHLSIELFKARAGVNILHVPYNGGPPATNGAIAGDVDMTFQTANNLFAGLEARSLKALAVTGDRRLASLPDVPTFAEAGVPDFVASSWIGVLVRRGTPQPVVHTLNQALAEILDNPDIQDVLVRQGFESTARDTTPQAFGTLLKTELARNAQLVEAAGIRNE